MTKKTKRDKKDDGMGSRNFKNRKVEESGSGKAQKGIKGITVCYVHVPNPTMDASFLYYKHD